MRVLISGGGIAGLTLAYWLHQYNIPAVVIEQAQAMRREGHGIDFLGTGYDVASRMGLIDRLAARQIPFERLVYVNKDGKPIAKVDTALLRKVTDGKHMGLMHATLEAVLYEALEETIEVRFGRWITAIEAGPDAVVVTFNDGTTESFDLLIGADGVHSRTRALVFGPEEQFSRSLGYTIACYRLPDRYGIGRTYKLYSEPGRQVVAYGTNIEGELLIFFMYQSAKPEHVPREQRLAHLRQVFAGMGWLTEQFLCDVSPSQNVFMDAVIQIQMPTWHRGRVALVGDACDCPTLFAGQGASLAMGGAYLLAKALYESADYQEAFQRYQQQMFAYVQAEQKSGRSFAKSFLPGSPPGPLRPTNDDESAVAAGVSWSAPPPAPCGEPLVSARRQARAARKIARFAPAPVICWPKKECKNDAGGRRKTMTVTPPPKPKGLLKWAFLLPRYLYRWHLGWMLGHRALMVTHLGRKTGRRRQTVLEVIHYDPATQECIVAAGWGKQTDWYRNLQAHPALEVQVGSTRYLPVQRFLTFEETWVLLSDYQRAHPRGWRVLLRFLGYGDHGSQEELRAIAQVVRAVAFRPPQRNGSA